MARTGLHGPHALNEKTIDANVSANIGAYALGRMNNDTFYVDYVGRSDTDLNKRLKDWIGKYPSFKYGHFDTVQIAFVRECRMYHDFSGLDNSVHPARPRGASYGCPDSNCTDLD
jgi:hypothetical protein